VVFSSSVFLFLFVPTVLTGYFALPKANARNLFLLTGSLFFDSWGEVFCVLVLLLSICCNTLFGVRISRNRGTRSKFTWLEQSPRTYFY